MKAVVYDGKQAMVKDVPKPVPTSTQALIQVHAVGICGTDIAIIKGHLPTPIPLILGHEIAGEVVEVGKSVNRQWIGKRVTTEINSNICGKCFYCKRNIPTQCVSRKALGIDIDGGFANFIAVESYLLHEIPSSINYLQATFIEPLAAAYQTFEMMPLEIDDKTIVIFGMGRLGLLLLQVAKSKGLNVIAIDGSNVKLALAKKWGAMFVINRIQAQGTIVQLIKEHTQGLGADIVVDCTGQPEGLHEIIAACRTRGKIHMKSTHGLAVPIPLTDVVVREITIFSSRCGPFEKAIIGLKSGEIHVDELITQIFPLDHIDLAIASYSVSRDHIKTILDIQ
jgi:threonine dehydrogenase-like Zn-dependent dehydrogenase